MYFHWRAHTDLLINKVFESNNYVNCYSYHKFLSKPHHYRYFVRCCTLSYLPWRETFVLHHKRRKPFKAITFQAKNSFFVNRYAPEILPHFSKGDHFSWGDLFFWFLNYFLKDTAIKGKSLLTVWANTSHKEYLLLRRRKKKARVIYLETVSAIPTEDLK